MDLSIRFSALIRKGLRFRGRFEEAKRAIQPAGIAWYPYDSFANLFLIQRLLRSAGLSLDQIIGGEPVLDVGAGDGALSLFLESLGHRVHAIDCSSTNMNRMQGLRALAAKFESRIEIQDADLDGRFELEGHFGAALFLGTMYHLKNPYYVLELLAQRARFCILSTRIARLGADRTTRLDGMPVAYLLDAEECNADATNYWIFTPAAVELLAKRTGWQVCSTVTSGNPASDPVTPDGDERMFALLRSRRSV